MTLPRRRAIRTPHAFTPAHIRWLRLQLCENTTEFAKRWSVSYRTVQDWEQGRRHPNRWLVPRMLTLYRACEAKVR